MSVVIIINDNEPPNVSRYFIVRTSVRLINGILIANYTIYLFKTIYRIIATAFIYSILLYYLVNIIKRHYATIIPELEHEII